MSSIFPALSSWFSSSIGWFCSAQYLLEPNKDCPSKLERRLGFGGRIDRASLSNSCSKIFACPPFWIWTRWALSILSCKSAWVHPWIASILGFFWFSSEAVQFYFLPNSSKSILDSSLCSALHRSSHLHPTNQFRLRDLGLASGDRWTIVEETDFCSWACWSSSSEWERVDGKDGCRGTHHVLEFEARRRGWQVHQPPGWTRRLSKSTTRK